MEDSKRRQFLSGVGSVATVGLLAGCSGSEPAGTVTTSGDERGTTTSESRTDTATTEPMDTMGDTPAADSGGDGGVPQAVTDWLSETNNYHMMLSELTGRDRVTVEVGTQGNDGHFAYAPPAIEVDAGTTVVWEWTGEGGAHNVVAENAAFESELTDEAGYTFEQAFESSGVVIYYCEPHRDLGMKGAIVVE